MAWQQIKEFLSLFSRGGANAAVQCVHYPCVRSLYCAVNGVLLVLYFLVTLLRQRDEAMTSTGQSVLSPQPQTLRLLKQVFMQGRMIPAHFFPLRLRGVCTQGQPSE